MNTTDTPQVTSTNENQKRGKKQSSTTLAVNHNQEQICDITGHTESECGVIFTTGTINIGRTAIKQLSSQLAQWEREQRGG
jgi:hypothetical protein